MGADKTQSVNSLISIPGNKEERSKISLPYHLTYVSKGEGYRVNNNNNKKNDSDVQEEVSGNWKIYAVINDMCHDSTTTMSGALHAVANDYMLSVFSTSKTIVGS
jgi:hypothetical protein